MALVPMVEESADDRVDRINRAAEANPYRVVVDDPYAERKYTFEFIRAESADAAIEAAVDMVRAVDRDIAVRPALNPAKFSTAEKVTL